MLFLSLARHVCPFACQIIILVVGAQSQRGVCVLHTRRGSTSFFEAGAMAVGGSGQPSPLLFDQGFVCAQNGDKIRVQWKLVRHNDDFILLEVRHILVSLGIDAATAMKDTPLYPPPWPAISRTLLSDASLGHAAQPLCTR